MPLGWSWLIVIYVISVYVIHEMPAVNAEWLRSIFFLNMIIPSSDYYMWNALYIWGSLSNFMVFYAFFPLLWKIAGGFEKSFVLTLSAMGIGAASRYFLSPVFSMAGGTSYILLEQGFLAVLWYFCIGILIFFAFQDNNLRNMIIMLITWYLATQRYTFLNLFTTGIFLSIVFCLILFLTGKSRDRKKNNRWNIFEAAERYSFPFYICHMLIFRFVKYLGEMFGWSMRRMAVLSVIMPMATAVFLWHFICVPSAKLAAERVSAVMNEQQEERETK